MCVNVSEGEYPTIYVNQPYAGFDMIGTFTFKNLIFSGVN